MGKSRHSDDTFKRIKPVSKATKQKTSLKYIDPDDCLDEFSEDFIDESDEHHCSDGDDYNE